MADTSEGRTSILLVDPDGAHEYVSFLRSSFEISPVATEDAAMRAIRMMDPALVITELSLAAGDGISLCQRVRALDADGAPSVLVLTSTPARVGDALVAGCDGVLVKPFDLNLLSARVGALLRQRGRYEDERRWAEQAVTGVHPVRRGTNITVPEERCPACAAGNAVTFDTISRGRAWYACLACRQVWIGNNEPRRERGVLTSRRASYVGAVPTRPMSASQFA